MPNLVVPVGLALFAAMSLPALAQDASADPSLSLSAPASSAETTAVTEGPLDAQVTDDNSFASLIAAVNANESVDLSAVTDESKVNLVLISTLQGTAEDTAAFDAALAAQPEMLTTFRMNVDANAAIKSKLIAEGYAATDVVAVRADANGSTIVYVDDRG